MNAVLLILASLLSAGVGVFILAITHCSTTPAIAAGSFFVLLSIAFAVPARFKDFVATVAPYLPDIARRPGGPSGPPPNAG
jgi:hypothetical protein